MTDTPPTELQLATLRLAHYELQYHRLQSSARGVLSSRRPFSKAQAAVLNVLLDDLEKVCAEKTPGIDYRT